MKPVLILLIASVSLFISSCSEDSDDVKPLDVPFFTVGSIEDSKSNDALARKGGPGNSEPVFHFADPSTPIDGASSSIIRGPNGISMSFDVTGVTPGNAYTVWYVIFNVPGECATSPCTEADIFNPATQADVTFGAGKVAGSNRLSVSGHRSVGDLSGSAIPFFNEVFGLNHPVFGLIDPEGAEVHLLSRCHGPKVPANMPEQIDSFVGGCTDFLDAGVVPVAVGECADIHFSQHLPA